MPFHCAGIRCGNQIINQTTFTVAPGARLDDIIRIGQEDNEHDVWWKPFDEWLLERCSYTFTESSPERLDSRLGASASDDTKRRAREVES